MSKELTLAELAMQGSKETTKKVNVIKTTEQMKEVSINDIAKTLPGKPQEEVKNPVVVDNAFKALDETIQERKDRINKAMPTILENAREIAMEKEMAKFDEKEETEDEDMLDEEDSTLDEEKVEEEAGAWSNNSNEYDIEGMNVEEEEETEEPSYDLDINTEELKEEESEVEEKESNVIDLEDYKESDHFKEVDEYNDLIKDIEKENSLSVDEIGIEETTEEAMARFKKSLSEIQVTTSDIDISSFTIAKKPVSASAILSNVTSNKTTRYADWVMYHTGRSFRISECSGPELDALRKSIDNSNSINGVIASFKLIYDHIVDANKPSFEAWAKTVRVEDIESLYYGLYKACYGDINLIARECKKEKDHGCGKSSILNTDIKSMVEFKDSDVEDKFNDILRTDTTTSTTNTKPKSKLLVISDNFAVSYSAPTIYNTFIQFAAIKPEITNKYSELLNSMAYVNDFFMINKETKQLVPMNVKVYPNNINKTVYSKLKVYVDVLKTLSNDQYNVFKSKMENLTEDSVIKYIYPETKCPECGNTIAKEDVDSMLTLLFTRAQLAQIKSL